MRFSELLQLSITQIVIIKCIDIFKREVFDSVCLNHQIQGLCSPRSSNDMVSRVGF